MFYRLFLLFLSSLFIHCLKAQDLCLRTRLCLRNGFESCDREREDCPPCLSNPGFGGDIWCTEKFNGRCTRAFNEVDCSRVSSPPSPAPVSVTTSPAPPTPGPTPSTEAAIDTTPTPNTPNTPDPSESNETLRTDAVQKNTSSKGIVSLFGYVAGAALGLIVIAFMVVFLYRKRQEKRFQDALASDTTKYQPEWRASTGDLLSVF